MYDEIIEYMRGQRSVRYNRLLANPIGKYRTVGLPTVFCKIVRGNTIIVFGTVRKVSPCISVFFSTVS